MASVSKVLLIRRFLHAWRTEGGGWALRRTGGYLMRRLRPLWPGWLCRNRPAAGASYLLGMWQTLAREEAFHVTKSPAILQRRRQIALIGDLNLPQCRKYRVEQLASYLQSGSVDVEYAHYEDVPRATRIMQLATHVIEYRLQSTPVTEMLRYEARRLRLPILYDLDDPLFSISAYETYRNMQALDPAHKAGFLAAAPRYLNMMNGADVMSVSTPGMVAHAALYTSRPLFLRRNFADHETLNAGRSAARGKRPDGVFRVAFSSGSRGHEMDLAEIIEPLSIFVLGAENRQLMILGHFDRKLLPAALAKRTRITGFADYPRYLATLAQADCAVMPMCDDLFNRCKSAVRVLDAAAAGVPSIVSAVGDLPNVVKHGRTGMIAETGPDWGRGLHQMASAPETASQMGHAARQDLEARWIGSNAAHIIDPEMLRWLET